MTTEIVHAFTTKVNKCENSKLNSILRKFWEDEEIPTISPLSEEDQFCEKFYTQTTTRNGMKRYF